MSATPTLPRSPRLTLDRLVRRSWAPFAGLILAAAIGAAATPLDQPAAAVDPASHTTPDRPVTPHE